MLLDPVQKVMPIYFYLLYKKTRIRPKHDQEAIVIDQSFDVMAVPFEVGCYPFNLSRYYRAIAEDIFGDVWITTKTRVAAGT